MKELAGHWAETLREGADTDPDTGESLAEPYIRERRELYGLLLLRSGRLGGAKFPGQSWSKLDPGAECLKTLTFVSASVMIPL